MERARVLQIISGFAVEGPLGGIERFGIELSRHLDSACLESILCGLWRYGTPYEEERVRRLQDEGIDAFFAADWDDQRPYRSFFRAWRGILKHLDAESVDLIHSHCQFGDILALMLARRIQAQAVLRTVHNEREWPKRPWRRWLLTNILYPVLFQREIGVSQKVKDNLERRWMARLTGRKSRCIYNAIDLERFDTPRTEEWRAGKLRELGLSTTGRVVMSIGRLTRQKGYSILLEAGSLVLQELPSVRFVIIGGGELAGELENIANQLRIDHAVLFTGPREDVEELLGAADLFVSSSLWEGLPSVILESMAARVPVVATNVSGTRELVDDGTTGLLVPPGDPQALAEAISQMLQGRRNSERMTQQAYRHVQDFSIIRVARQYEELYDGLLD